MNKLILLIALLVNFLFMMLTTLLPIIVFNITNSAGDVGVVLTIFMIALLVIRVLCLKIDIRPNNAVTFGSGVFFVGFVMIHLIQGDFLVFCIGAILFGIAIGLIPPALLTILTNSNKHTERNVSNYNSVVAVASIFSPIFGESLYNYSPNIVDYIWIFGSAMMLILAFVTINSRDREGILDRIPKSSSVNVFKLRQYRKIFLILLFSAVSYGTIISYLPIYLSSKSFSIGMYYLFFWGAYIIAQYVKPFIAEKLSLTHLILLSLLGLGISMVMISIGDSAMVYNLAGVMYGFCNGLLYNLFYSKASQLEDEKGKNDAYAVIGLMSYIGVGFAPAVLSPFLAMISDLKWIFAISAIFILLSLLIFTISERKERLHASIKKRSV